MQGKIDLWREATRQAQAYHDKYRENSRETPKKKKGVGAHKGITIICFKNRIEASGRETSWFFSGEGTAEVECQEGEEELRVQGKS